MNTKSFNNTFDVIVVGGGHAGIEAAHAAATMGSHTLLITLDKNKIGWMPCNPAIGGLGKGHIVFEVSALGGLMPKLCTQTYIQARMLNTKKGPAVQGLRLQIDKDKYAQLSREKLEALESLTIVSDMVDSVIINDDKQITGVITKNNQEFYASSVVVTTGTFLKGTIHIGQESQPGGRRDEQAANSLSPQLKELGLKLGRLKTGTPPRLLKESVDFSKMERQDSHELEYLFEFYPHKVSNTHDCYITHTNANTHKVIHDNLSKSALFGGKIEGIGPRYCPSIEDKISRFADKASHHIFVEPEGADSDELYPNGLSTSLPLDVQLDYIQSIKGFENAVITKPGYAIEYDFVHPEQLKHTLELKEISGLFLAGQINGTTGYEEAAGQGLIAGINAHLKINNKPEFTLSREESYIGVMIDDLVSLGVDEPYRMFTSRAERRISLRQDNAFARLTDKGYTLGLIDEQLYFDFCKEKNLVNKIVSDLRSKYNTGQLLRMFGELTCNKEAIRALTPETLADRTVINIYADIKYYEYLIREEKEIRKAQKYRQMSIPMDLQFATICGLSKELQEKLNHHKPDTIAQAMLIPGMTPAAISLLIFRSKELIKST
ncbi:tRNA uridine-5-carboxymethylaminomethyl(34) synthesis enzyme MnmG [bacterium]|jgi:tRNA uridine 5-carboxymethylaminomethyl modification enzyme|nr:tRNA uridine-5-carboxymethylaminomethyl(34) synthesis enzyme MnmG [bacterium]MBT5014893.1 tRNA uridine-5-carboxymethylaminomethyl(34) synthesis enzyme MnmG [bacterium]